MRGGCLPCGEPGQACAGELGWAVGAAGVPVKLLGAGCAFPQAHGHSDPVEISTVCVVWSYNHGLEEGDNPRKPQPEGKG